MSAVIVTNEAGRVSATAMQRAMLTDSVLRGRTGASLRQVVIEGPSHRLNPAEMQAVWCWLAERHEALRIRLRDDPVRGLSLESVPADAAETLHLPSLETADANALEALLAADRTACADPLRGPGWRLSLVKGDAGRSSLVWTVHAAVLDACSIALVLEDMADRIAGRQPRPAAALGIRQVVSGLGGRDRAEAETFFKGLMGEGQGAAVLLAPARADAAMSRLDRALNATATARLHGLVRGLGLGPKHAVQAAWALVLARWTGQSETCIGVMTSLRPLVPGAERVAGNLGALLPFPVRFQPDVVLSQLLADLKAQADAMQAHAQASPNEIRAWLDAGGAGPGFETILTYEPQSLAARLRDGKALPEDWGVSLRVEQNAPVSLTIIDGDLMQVELQHDTAQLAPQQAERMLDHLIHLLEAMADGGPNRQIAELNMLSSTEREALLTLGSPSRGPSQAIPCPVTRFEAVAATRAETVALDDPLGVGRVSYRALEGRANALAWRLAEAGVAAGDVVGLCLPRRAENVIAMLAALKLGAVFLPMDPDQSEGWRRDMLAITKARYLVAHDAKGVAADGIQIVTPDAGSRPAPPHRPAPAADHGAYLLFTSGSSGKPKAVLGLTGALSAHADAVIADYGLTETDRVLQFAGQTFDVFLEEVIPTLLSGGRVVFRDEETATSASGFLDFVTRHRVTVLNLPAGFWQVLVQDMVERTLTLPGTVRLLVAGSERVLPAALRQWQRVAPGVTFINAYGPTETTISATAWTLPAGVVFPATEDDVPIGRPLSHARVVLRAFDGTLAPHRAVGVLWIGGQAVTGGYLDNPQRTQALFQPDPWHPGDRLYCTGDLAFWRADGNLGFLGRGDRQVKLRGHRIDLHQVEATLAAVPGLRQVHVGVETGKSGTRLLAWIVCDPSLAPEAVAAEMGQHLPDYMMPRLVPMDALPMKPGGKIDVNALPRPAIAAVDDQGAADALASEVAACMAATLGVDAVGIDQDFRDIGGDSLLALRLIGLVEQRMGFSLHAADLMGHPTARSLAKVIRTGREHAGCTVTIQPEGTQPPFYAIHVLGRNEEFYRPLSEALGPDFPMYGVSIGLPRRVEEVDVSRIAQVYVEEIQRHHPEGPIALAGFSLASHFAFEVAQQLWAAGREVRLLALIDMEGPGGRAVLHGRARLAVHLRQFRKTGLSHLRWLLVNLRDRMTDRQQETGDGEDAMIEWISANQRAVDAYRPQPYPGPITVFRAADNLRDSTEAIRTGLGWADVAHGGLEVVDVPGGHMSMLSPGNVQVMAQHVKTSLATARPSRG